MQKHQYVGKTLDDALAQAASDLGTQKENLSYNILPSEGGSLLKKLLFKTIKVEAWIEKKADLQEAARKAVREAIEGGNQRQHTTVHSQEVKQHGKRTEARNEKRNGPGRSDHTEQAKNKKNTAAVEKEQKKPQQARVANQKPARPQAEASSKKGLQERQKPVRNASEGPETKPRLEAEDNPNAITFDTPGVKELLADYTNAFVKVFEAEADNVTYERTEKGDMRVTVDSSMLEDLLARSDRLSGSYEHVFKRIAQKKLGDLPQRLYLNAGNAADKRVENLREMARSMAEKVKQTGRSITVNSKSGQERRIIHVTIDEIEGVATRSIGTGEGRKLVIYSTDKRQRKRSSGKRLQGERMQGESSENNESTSSDMNSFEGGGGAISASESEVSTKPGSGARRSRSRRSRHRSSQGTLSGTAQSADSQVELSARAPGDHDS